MIAAFRGEWLKLVKRPALWILGAILLGVLVFFVYLPGWWIFAHGPHGALPATIDLPQLKAAYYPGGLIPQFLGDMSGLLGAACFALGVLDLGSDFGWGSIHTLSSLPPSRLASLGGRLGALALAVLCLNLVLWSVAAALATTFAEIDGVAVALPPPGLLAAAVGTSWLISSMWCAFGVMLAAAFRQPVVPLAVGLIYMLVVEGLVLNLLGSTGSDTIRGLEKVVPGPNAGALVQAFGHGYVPAAVQLPATLVGTGEAVTALVLYLFAFCAAAALLLRGRDLT